MLRRRCTADAAAQMVNAMLIITALIHIIIQDILLISVRAVDVINRGSTRKRRRQ